MKKSVTSIFVVIAIITTLFTNVFVVNAAMGDYGGNITGATWCWPLHGFTSESSAYSKITSSYGHRGGSYNSDHKGMDIGASNGTAVYPTRSGTIYLSDASPDGSEGRSIIINHGDGYYSAYYHLSSLNVSKGQWVDTNTQIGAVGGSGYGQDGYYAYHLHFAIHYGSSWSYTCNVNPCPSGYTRVGSSMQASAGGYPKGNATISYAVTTTPQYDSKPSNCSISANYTSIGVGDTVSFTYNIDNATSKYLGIDYAGSSRYATISVSQSSGKINYTFTQPGTYCCIIEGSNNKGYSCSPGVYVKVIDSKPIDCQITADKTNIFSGDTVTFTYNIKGATAKCIGIDSNGKRYDGVSVSSDSGKATYKFKEPGTYCCIIEGYNNKGYSCSPGIYVHVSGEKPSNCTISANKYEIYTGDTVTFNYTIHGATVQGIGIDKDKKRYANITANAESGSSTYTFNEPGTYCCIIEGYNNNGYHCSPGVYVTVTQRPSTISANYTSVGVGDRVTFSYSIDANSSTAYRGIGIDYAGGSRYTSFSVNDTVGTASYVFTEPGTYCCIVEGKTYGGYTCSPGVYVKVIDTKPNNCTITSNTNGKIFVGDTVTFNYTINGATNKCVGIDCNKKRYASIGANSDKGTVYYTFNEPGTYCCIIEGYNNVGYSCSSGIWIQVKEQYHIAYNSNGGDVVPGAQTKIQDEDLVLSDTILTRPGYVFLGWAENNPNAENATYPAGGTFTGNYSTTLYAVWKLADYTVTFNATGGTTPIANKTVTYKSSYGTLPTPILKEHKFKGWFTAPNGGTQITSDSTVLITDNQTLYAQWEYIEPHTETIINKNGNTLTISTNLFSIASGKIIVCGYKSGRLIDFVIKDYSSDNDTFELTGDIDTVKVMVWDGLSIIKPLCKAEEIPSSKWIIE